MRERFDREFQALLDPENPDIRSIWTYIERSIRQFSLDGSGVTANDILSEVYARAINRLVEQQKPIENPIGWVRLAAYNVIREKSRERRRQIRLQTTIRIEWESEWPHATAGLISEDRIDDNIQVLQEALQRLNPRDREILYWRFVEGLSWDDVGKRLPLNGSPKQNEATVRQQGHRARARLRKLFHDLKSQNPVLH